jgi:hypothetical protein
MTRVDRIEHADSVHFDLAALRRLNTTPADELRRLADADPAGWQNLRDELIVLMDAVSEVAMAARRAGERWQEAAGPECRGLIQ